MKTFKNFPFSDGKTIFFRGRKDKLEIIAKRFSYLFSGKVLDVGCGNNYFKKLIPGKCIGIDKYGDADVVKDISEGLPFAEKSFDTVVAFDVLEHIDDLHFLFDELCRVARKWIVVTLPNMYEWRFRLSFLLGGLTSGKYGLSETSLPDRHRWLFSLSETKNFIEKRAKKNNFELSQEIICFYKYNKILPKIITKIGSHLGRKFQNLFASHYLVVLKRKI